MATTTPFSFAGLAATVDNAKVAQIVDAYEGAQGDEDKADEIENACFYEGLKIAYLHVLDLLHGTDFLNQQPEVHFSLDPRRGDSV